MLYIRYILLRISIYNFHSFKNIFLIRNSIALCFLRYTRRAVDVKDSIFHPGRNLRLLSEFRG